MSEAGAQRRRAPRDLTHPATIRCEAIERWQSGRRSIVKVGPALPRRAALPSCDGGLGDRRRQVAMQRERWRGKCNLSRPICRRCSIRTRSNSDHLRAASPTSGAQQNHKEETGVPRFVSWRRQEDPKRRRSRRTRQ